MLRNAVLRSAPASWRTGLKRFEDFRRSGDAIDDIYARAERLIRDNPERYGSRYVSVGAVLTRR